MNLDREIEQLLSVDPSPEFVAKVRARVAAEPRPGRLRFDWKLPAGAVCAAALVAALTIWPSADPPLIGQQVATPAAPAAPVVEGVATTPPPAVPVAAPVPQRRAPSMARAVESPDILVSEEEIRSFRRLLTQVQQGHIPEMPGSEAGEGSREPFGPPWIEISPVVITPIAQLAQPEGERQ
jgi:hypothetical protein